MDIWALACVLHELATGKVAFHQDWAVREYFQNKFELTVSLPSVPAFFQHHISGCINDLLRRDWNQRPSASVVCLVFLSYSRLLDLSIVATLINSQSYPSYTEWKELVREYPNERDFFSQLADLYERLGEIVPAQALQRIAIHDHDGVYGEAPDAISVGSLLMESGEIDPEKDSCGRASRFRDAAVAEKPDSFWSWHNLCKVNIRRGDYNAAIGACSQGNTRFPSNPWPVLAATNVHAARNDYDLAILMYMDFLTPQKEKDLSCMVDRLSPEPAVNLPSDRIHNLPSNELPKKYGFFNLND